MYIYQIELSELNLKKTYFNLKISQKLIIFSKYLENNSAISRSSLQKQIRLNLCFLKSKIFFELRNNILHKLNLLEKMVNYKKDKMYCKIRNIIMYREKREKAIKNIENNFKIFSNLIMRNNERSLFLLNESKVKYEMSSIDLNIGNATSVIKNPEIKFQDIKCTFENYTNLKNNLWKSSNCEINKKDYRQCNIDKTENGKIELLNKKINVNLQNLNKIIIMKLYDSLKDLYSDIVKLKILVTLKKLQYFIKGQETCTIKKDTSILNSNSKLIYVLSKGNLECDKRFLLMINDTLGDIEKYKDPIVVRMGVQFILARRYVEDIIYLKEE